MKYSLIALILATLFLQTYTQVCSPNCEANYCYDDNGKSVCGKCSSDDMSTESNCYCAEGQYYDGSACQPCDPLCKTCTQSGTCTSCVQQRGLRLNLDNNLCECYSNSFITTNDNSNYCQQLYKYGNTRVEVCPEGTIPKEDIMLCDMKKPEDVLPGDRIWIIIVAMVIIIVQIILSLMLYNYLMKKLIESHQKERSRTKELSEEEQEYLQNQAEFERQRIQQEELDREKALQEEKRKRQLAWEEERLRRQKEFEQELEEKKRQQQEEQERLRKQREEEMAARNAQLEQERLEMEERERLQREEQERLKAEEEERRRKHEEEMARRRKEEEERQKRLDEEARLRREQAEKEANERELERQRLAEEERKRREAEEAERQRLAREAEEERRRREAEEAEARRKAMEAEKLRLAQIAEEERRRKEEEERERKRLEEEERKRREAEQAEKERQRRLAMEAREKRRQERLMQRQSTMAANEDKLRQMREQRAMLERQKTAFQQEEREFILNADNCEKENTELQSLNERSKKRELEIKAIKEGILKKKQEIDAKRKEMDAQLEGVDFEGARQKVNQLSQEDIVFIQNLKNPPDRIKLCLEAVVAITCNTAKKQKWDDIKKEIGSVNFRRGIYSYDVSTMHKKVENYLIKDCMTNPLWNVKKMYSASQATGVLCEWMDSLLKFQKMMSENKVLFEQNKELKTLERSMDTDMQQLEDLEQEEIDERTKQRENSDRMASILEKQQTFRKSATIKMEEIKKKQQEINALQTDNLTLMEVDEEDDSSDGENAAILNNL